MPGQVIRIQELASFDFSNLGDNGTTDVPLAEHVDVSQATMATLMVRAHSGTLDSGTSLKVIAYPDGHTMEDPASEYQGGTSLGSCEFNYQSANGSADGLYLTDELTAGSMGQMINVVLRATQASPASGSTVTGRISVDLSLKW